MRGACAYCGGVVHEAELGPYQLCAGCFSWLEDELTTTAMRVGRIGRRDAETVAEVPVPAELMEPASVRPRRPQLNR